MKRLVLLAGVTGINIDAVMREASKEFGAETIKLEDHIEEELGSQIFAIAEQLVRKNLIVHGKIARIAKGLIEASKDPLIVAAHMTYYRRRHIVPSPATSSLLSSPATTVIVGYVEDYYHALKRMAERVLQGRTPDVARAQPLDPLGYLYWRGTDQSMLDLYKLFGAETYVFGMKHSREMHMRMLAHALGVEYRGVKRFRKVYVSHPITKVRKKSREMGTPINSFKDSLEIEEFKQILEKECGDLIIFSPTTIDEAIYDEYSRIKTIITRNDRWPHPVETLHEYEYPIDLSGPEFTEYLYPAEETIKNPGYLKLLQEIIENQIESRDYAYVSQADFIIAYRPTMYGEEHRGVEAEIHTASGQGKTVYALVPEEEWSQDQRLFRGVHYPLRDLDKLLKALKCQ
ncbi:MAG: hypothetical protein F7C07_00700 [Desulfurococcales archaeon]|nr:hypothetical protein [Desulfurococcales archaeon]